MVAITEIARHLGESTSADAEINGLALASSEVRDGDLFIALPGANSHGARYVAQAVERGARAVLTDADGARQIVADVPVLVVREPRRIMGELADWFYGQPSLALQIAGITGTNGKTTTTYLLDAALRASGQQTGLIGTVQTRIGDDVLPSARTTPEAPSLQRLFAQMHQAGVTSVSMEVSSHALALHRVKGTRFAVAGFTQLTQDHLDFHGSMEAYFEAKASLFAPEYAASAVITIDDEYGRRLLANTSVPALALSINGRADWWVSDVDVNSRGGRARVHAPDGTTGDLMIRIPGRYNIANALLATACAVNMGVEMETALAGMSQCAGVPGRMERVEAGQDFEVIVDYAHTPDAVRDVLTELRTIASGRIITVLGCGGDRDAAKRPLMGAAAAEGSDAAIFTTDNPRSEDPQSIIDAMLTGVSEKSRVQVELDRREAIALAVAQAHAGDIVLVAGKGHESGQEVNGVIRPFDDREEARRAVQEGIQS